MIYLILFILSFILSLFFIKIFIPILKYKKIIAIDQQKINKPIIPTSAGIPVFIAFCVLILFLYIYSYFFNLNLNFNIIFVSLLSILIVTFVGFLDDIKFNKLPTVNKYGDKSLRLGLPAWLKPLLTIFGSIPLILFFIGNSTITIPLFNIVLNLGNWYYLCVVPILFIVVANSTNMLAGMNGLEGSLMFIICLALGIFLLINNRIESTIIAFIGCGLAFAYILFNWYPAKILPGDSFTYLFGGFFATISIIGDIELFSLFIFIPWIVEIILKLTGKLKVRSLGDLQKDGSLKMPYKNIYSWTHIFMFLPTLFKKRFKEWQITLCIDLVVIIFCILGFIIFI
jgi:UDP-N-acetylglucosamine--dolichyl-phosphate N-acetylglucosaminephosphotransferase